MIKYGVGVLASALYLICDVTLSSEPRCGVTNHWNVKQECKVGEVAPVYAER